MKLTIKYLFLLTVLVGISSISIAQSLDEIIDKHLKAHGDINKWEKVENLKITGVFTAFSEEDDFMAIKTKCGKYYSELSLGQFNVVEAFNGETGWTIDPWMEITFPRELNKHERNVFLQKAEYFSPFYNYQEEGSKAEYIGETNVDGVDVYEIKLTRLNGNIEKWYLDRNTYLEYKCESYWVDFTYRAPAETFFDDFRDFNGIIIPCYIERMFNQRNRILVIDNIEFNVDIDPSVFLMPKSDEIKNIDFLTGNWGVAVTAYYAPRDLWYPVDSSHSQIEFAATNMIRENISYNASGVQTKINNFAFDSDKSEYFLSTYLGYSSKFRMFNGSLNDSSLVFKSTTIGCDTAVPFIIRITYNNISENGFNAEFARSYDNEKSWSPTLRLNYFKED